MYKRQLLTQGSEPSQVGRIQGLFGTTQTACTAVSAAAAGASFAVARWLPFVTASAITAVALVATAVVWRTVPGHVHPELAPVDVEGRRSTESVGDAPVQPAIGVSVEVQ